MGADTYLRFTGGMTPVDRFAAPRMPELAAFAREVANESRAAMLVALTDGRAWTVGELAHRAGIARNTASGHVRRLVRAGLVVEARQGRHCYVTLAGPPVAHAIEAMSLATPTRPAAPSLRGGRHDQELAAGRTCYRHLAGRLGVGLVEEWQAAELIAEGWQLTDAGRSWFAGLGIDTAPDPRRPLLRPCIDWTERRPHAAGVLADRIAATAFEHGWIVRGTHPRSARVTPDGDNRLRPASSPPKA